MSLDYCGPGITHIAFLNRDLREKYGEEWDTTNLLRKNKKVKDWARYQAAKKEHYLHSSCTAEQCVLECLYFPGDGYQAEDGNIRYEDSDLDPSFMGTYGALEARKKIAAMSPREYQNYRRNLKLKYNTSKKLRKR